MTLDQLNQAVGSGDAKIEDPSTADSTPTGTATGGGTTSPAQPTQPSSIDQFTPMLAAIQSVQRWLTAAPTFVPQTFQDQIQFVFDGTTYWLYFYANNQWNPVEVNMGKSYGDGSDGTVVLDGSATFSWASLVSNVYTLNRDIFVAGMVVDTGVTLKPNGYRIFSSKEITVAGTISVKGGNATAGSQGGSSTTSGGRGTGGTHGSKGVGIPSGTIKQPGDGKDGNDGLTGGASGNPNTKNGVTGTAETNCILPNAGPNGGNSGKGNINPSTGFTDNSSTGGIGGAVTQTTKPSVLSILWSLINAFGNIGCNPSSGSGAGGGCGLGTSSNDSDGGGGAGGGSGAPGGFAWIAAPAITVTSTGKITADGGDGGPGGIGGTATNAGVGGNNFGGGGGGGGAPGNGGLVALFTPNFSNAGSVTANAGAVGNGGTGQTGGSNGSTSSAGSNGLVVQLIP